jgi:hypothetical protein
MRFGVVTAAGVVLTGAVVGSFVDSCVGSTYAAALAPAAEPTPLLGPPAPPASPAAPPPLSPPTAAPLPLSPTVAEKPSPTPPESRWDYAVFPFVFYTPETSLGLVAGFAIFDDTPKPGELQRRDDSVALGVQATLRRQYSVSVSAVKWWDDARWQLTEDAALVRFPNTYWGLGNDTPESARDPFTQSGAVSRVTLAARAFEQVYVGGGFSTGWYDITGAAPDGSVGTYLQTTPVSGAAVGVGPILRRDTRDDALGAHRGSLSSLAVTFFPAALGGRYHFSLYELDQRSHFAIGSRSVLAVEAYGLSAPGHVPLAELPALGGAARLRGYFQGRYRDHVYLMAQAEWRIRVYGRFALAPFAGVGNVFPSLSAISLERTKYAGGVSIRFNLKTERDLYVHLDVAKSPISSGLYLNMGEAF